MARRTPLYDAHRALGARFVEFAGWEMPLSYTGAHDEHQAVRERCGLFDVSHMGEVEISGPGAGVVCQELTVNDVARLRVGEGQYTILCREDGGVIDDLILFRLDPARYLLVVNAATTASDLDWIRSHVGRRADVVDRSAELALLALQGPEAEGALRTVTSIDLPRLRPFAAARGPVAGRSTLITRTGYTGEDGFELLVDAADALPVWEEVLDAVRRRGGRAAGLGARDTLRLEAGLPLCGTDMDATTTPLEAGLAWVVKLGKGDFVGRAALARQAEAGVPRRLSGFELGEPSIARHGCAVWKEGARIGTVTSGAKSPTLGSFIGLCYVPRPLAAAGTHVDVEIRSRRVAARIVERPFYRRVRQEG
ncbi:MAG TPA: glycine cleavage system aminomethyltransferase GcvT [Candidatus Binatia bacterium]|jgi:aminomethyltransferase|nr:glycine cleavage system aminomethyltransferase GcvT [Candidatus Binatia bacterium]